MARLDSMGRFTFNHLAPGTYAAYTMKDEGGTRRYMSKAQLFGFADSPVVIDNHTPQLALYAYTEKLDAKPASKSGSTKSGPNTKPDKEKKEDKRLVFQVNTSNGEFDVLDTFHINFATPLKEFDSTKIRFTDEKYNNISIRDYRFLRDTTNMHFSMLYTWPTDTKYHLILAKDFAQDSAGRQLLKPDTLTIHTKKDIEYGEIRLRFTNLDLTRHPVLQFVVQDAVKYAFPFHNSREFKRMLFTPGEYELRILYDTNQNGIWDAGEFFGKHLQPEKVTPIRKKVTVKANWDNEHDITL